MNLLKVALLQILPGNSWQENMEIGREACRKARALGADIALFPEMWSNGYHVWAEADKLRADAIPGDGPYTEAFAKLAGELEMAIAVTLLESYEPSPRNTLILFDRWGRRVLTYAKVHTCDFDVERGLTPGEDFYVTDLDTALGPVKVGAMICYDREFPESARILMLKGAELVLVPNACPMELNRLAQLRGRAFENMMGIATCNYPAGQPDCNGHSNAFDGVAYPPEDEAGDVDAPGPDGGASAPGPDGEASAPGPNGGASVPETEMGSRDTCILEAGEEPGIYLAEFDLDMLREYRRTEAQGNAYRHPRKYHLLVEERIEEPFVRRDYRW